jgi:hypothetical protein
MRRKIAAVSIALAALLHGAGAKPVHRVELAPGYSVDVPDGFASCDAATNKALGNAAHLIVLRQMCASVSARKNAAVLVSLDPAAPVTVSSLPLRNLPVTVDTFDQVDSAVVDIVKAGFCDEMLKPYHLDACDLRKGSVAGVPTFIGEATGVNPQGLRLTIRAYLLPGAPDALAVAFFLKAPMPPKSLAAAEMIAASLRIAPAPAPVTGSPATLTIVPGVTVQVPKEWSACDAVSAAQLSRALQDETAKFCGNVTGLRVFYPRAPYYESVEIDSVAAQGKIDPAQIAQMTSADQVAKDREANCREITAPLISGGAVIGSCDTEAGIIAGHPAVIGTFIATRSRGANAGFTKIEGRSIEIPLEDKTIELRLSCESAIAAKITPEADEIVKSLTVP